MENIILCNHDYSDHFRPSKSLYGRAGTDGWKRPLPKRELVRRKSARKAARASRKANR